MNNTTGRQSEPSPSVSVLCAFLYQPPSAGRSRTKRVLLILLFFFLSKPLALGCRLGSCPRSRAQVLTRLLRRVRVCLPPWCHLENHLLGVSGNVGEICRIKWGALGHLAWIRFVEQLRALHMALLCVRQSSRLGKGLEEDGRSPGSDVNLPLASH